LLWLFWRWDFKNYFPGLASNHHPPDVRFLNSWDYRREPPLPAVSASLSKTVNFPDSRALLCPTHSLSMFLPGLHFSFRIPLLAGGSSSGTAWLRVSLEGPGSAPSSKWLPRR
jgi:hypothetical protein